MSKTPANLQKTSLILRLISGAFDWAFIVLISTISIPKSFIDTRIGEWLAYCVLAVTLLEIITRTSLGKLLLGLSLEMNEERPLSLFIRPLLKYGLSIFNALPVLFSRKHVFFHDRLCHSSINTKPGVRRMLRILIALILFVYLMITYGWTRYFGYSIESKYDYAKLRTMPSDCRMPAYTHNSSRHKIWFWKTTFCLPDNYRGLQLSPNLIYFSYGASIDKESREAAIQISVDPSGHPKDVSTIRNTIWGKLAVPDFSSRKMLDGTFMATPNSLGFYFNPISRVRDMTMLMIKGMASQGWGPTFRVRRYSFGSRLIYWISQKSTYEDQPGKVILSSDQIYLSSPKGYTQLNIFWQNLPRDKQFIEDIIASLHMVKASDSITSSEMVSAKAEQNLVHAYNALRTSGIGIESCKILLKLLEDNGKPDQRKAFAKLIAKKAMKDGEFVSLERKTKLWLLQY